jgi:hypothetical protein
MNNHPNDAIDNITVDKRFLEESKRGLRNKINCIINGCLAIPIARCILCSKYYCYVHIQLCLQLHSNEIEIINQLKSMRNTHQ